MALQINTASLPQFTDLVNRVFEKGLESYPYIMKSSGIVKMEGMPMNSGLFVRMAEMPVTTRFASVKPEGAAAKAASVQYGYEKDLQIRRFGLDVSITREMRIANKNPEVIQQLLKVAKSIPERMELDFAHRLSFATASSYVDFDGYTVDTTTGDGFSLAYSAHTLTGSPITYSNRLAGDPAFSKGALEQAERLVSEQTFDNLGNKVSLGYDVIWCTDDSVTNNRIDEELGAKADTTSSNAGTINVYHMKYKKVSVPYIATTAAGNVDTSKRRYWGIASTEYSTFHCKELEAPFMKAPRDGNNGEDFSTENWNYAGRGSYGIAIVSANWIKGSFPVN